MAVRIESQAEPIPGYTLIERLGGGGFGEVWKAVAPGGLHKAIKFVYGDLETASDEGMRAEQELKALNRVKTVRHPFILSIERIDIIEGQLMIVMELADRHLWDRFKECRAQGLPGIPREELLGYMEDTAEALDLMNDLYQLQHLDIKPQNLFLVHNHVKVADFGLVKDLQGMVASVTGGVTPVYAAPETFDGYITRFCDQYSLAIVYQELLTGVRPFSGGNVRQLIMQHLQAQPNLDSLPPADRPVIAQALAKKAEERHPSCRAMIRLLRSGGAGPAAIQTPSVTSRPDSGTSELSHSRQTHPASQEDTSSAKTAPSARRAVDAIRLETPPHTPQTPPTSDPGLNTRRLHVLPEGAPTTDIKPVPPDVIIEQHGDGVLFPALVIGIGDLGRAVLQQLDLGLKEHLGSRDLLPNLRLLYLDTDPEAVRQAMVATADAPLSINEVVLARVGRPSHYLKSKEAKEHLETWLDVKMLYRIPRNPATAGIRSIGRLAFVDNYPMIVRRFKEALKACIDPKALTQAAQQTGLGIRTNRPRVYLVAGLGGGTGSGMFLDAAYVLRHLLKNLGYDRIEVTAVLLLPAVERQANRLLGLGNVYAALTELNHYATPGNYFTARYLEREPPLTDYDPPFSRCLFLPLPPASDPKLLREATGLAAQYLYREVATPLGRIADMCRAGLQPARGVRCVFQTAGMYRLSWPRRRLAHRAGRHLCHQVVRRWVSKDSAPLRDTVKSWIMELWSREEFAAEVAISQLQEACLRGLGQSPESIIDQIVNPLLALKDLPAQITGLREGMAALTEVFGRSEGDGLMCPGTLQDLLELATTDLVRDWSEKLSAVAYRLIEQPEFRLAGAEEALRQMVALIEELLQKYEVLAKDITSQAQDAHTRLHKLLEQGPQTGGRRGSAPGLTPAEILRLYAKRRYQGLILYRVTGAYVAIRGYLSDQLREINYCRSRLLQLQKSFENPEEMKPPTADLGPGRDFYPGGRKTLEEAVAEFLGGLTPTDLNELDRRLQKMIQRRFSALSHVCLSSANQIKVLEVAMQQEAEEFVIGRLQGANVGAMYLSHYETQEAAERAIVDDFDQAMAELINEEVASRSEIRILAAPAGPEGERFRDLARRAMPEMELVPAVSKDDIIFYREVPYLPLAKLDILGTLGQEAYRHLLAVEHFTPHCRGDVAEWRGPINNESP